MPNTIVFKVVACPIANAKFTAYKLTSSLCGERNCYIFVHTFSSVTKNPPWTLNCKLSPSTSNCPTREHVCHVYDHCNGLFVYSICYRNWMNCAFGSSRKGVPCQGETSFEISPVNICGISASSLLLILASSLLVISVASTSLRAGSSVLVSQACLFV